MRSASAETEPTTSSPSPVLTSDPAAAAVRSTPPVVALYAAPPPTESSTGSGMSFNFPDASDIEPLSPTAKVGSETFVPNHLCRRYASTFSLSASSRGLSKRIASQSRPPPCRKPYPAVLSAMWSWEKSPLTDQPSLPGLMSRSCQPPFGLASFTGSTTTPSTRKRPESSVDQPPDGWMNADGRTQLVRVV